MLVNQDGVPFQAVGGKNVEFVVSFSLVPGVPGEGEGKDTVRMSIGAQRVGGSSGIATTILANFDSQYPVELLLTAIKASFEQLPALLAKKEEETAERWDE